MRYLSILAKPTAQNGGLFTASNSWIHSTRSIDSFELILVCKGPVCLFEDEQQYSLQEGQTLLLFPDRTHGGWKESPRGTSFFWLHFLLDRWELLENPKPGGIATSLVTHNSELLTIFFRQFLHRQETPGYSRWALDAALEVILSELEAETLRQPLEKETFWAAKVSSLIRSRYKEPLSTSFIAGELGLNPDYLSRIFRQETGKTITSWIRDWRLYIAKGLLSEGKLTISEIACQVRIEDPRYFARLFKRQEGISPDQYRRLFYRTHENSI